MRRLKNGVSAVVVMSFVLFFSGLSFVYGANQIIGGISGMGEEADIAGATVSLVGKPSIYTTSTLNGDGNSEFYLTLPTNSIFSLKFEKAGHITSYSTPTVLNSDIGDFDSGHYRDRLHVVLPSTTDWANLVSLSGITMQSGKGHLAVMPQNNTTDPDEMLRGVMTAIVKNLSGTSLVNTGNTRYVNLFGDSFTLTSTATSNTVGFMVVNLAPGTVITSAAMSGKTLNSRQTIIYPDSITSCTCRYDGIIESTPGNFTGSFEDENGTPVPSVTTNLIGVQSITSNGSGNFTLSNIPYNNIPKATTIAYLKATKSGYKDTYRLTIFDVDTDLTQLTCVSTSAFNQIALQAGVTIDSTKGCIGGSVKDSADNHVSGATVKIYNPDGTLNGARVYYMDSSMNIDPSLTSTSQGTFMAFNIEPSTLLILTAQKGVQEFPYVLDRTFANGFTMTGIRQSSGTPAALSPVVVSGHFAGGGTPGYYAEFYVPDSRHQATGITVTGPGISGTGNMVYDTGSKRWQFSPNSFLGTTIPTSPQTYVFTITTGAGPQAPVNKTITGYVTEFTTNLKPSGNAGSPIVFSWTGISASGARYGVQLSDNTGDNIWYSSYNLTGTSVAYAGGPALTTGTTYHFGVTAQVETGGVYNRSIAEGSFTYAPPAHPASISGKISYSGTKTGTIGIGLFTTSDFSGAPAYGTQIASPGTYSISNIAPGTYYLGASMDTNGNNVWDPALDPAGVYASNPKVLSNDQNAIGINITLTDPSGGATGDINGDSTINITDVILCLRQAIGLDTPNPTLADMNGDGLVNITDVILILRKAIGLDARMGRAV